MLLLVLFCALLVGTSAGSFNCFVCEQIVSFVLLNPSFGNDTEAVIDKFCAILPTHEEEICENVAHKIDLVLEALTKFLGVHEQESVHLSFLP